MAEKAYSARRIRMSLRSRRFKTTIPEPANQIAGRIGRGTRAVAARYDKREFVCKGTSTSRLRTPGN
jgi:hypothetical protein